MSNISIFILDENQHGYYIHGRSPHGTTDVNMRDMVMNLERESRALSGTRGLQANSSEQIFILKINRPLRIQYELLSSKYSVNNFRKIVKDKQRISFFIFEGFCSKRSKTNRCRTLHEYFTSILSESQWVSLCIHRSFLIRSSLFHSKSVFSRENLQL